MDALNFSIKRCSNNPQRLYVSFNESKPLNMSAVKQTLNGQQYKLLATTPSVMVFRSKEARLTLHTKGLIQIDLYNSNIGEIEHLIKEIFAPNIKDGFR